MKKSAAEREWLFYQRLARRAENGYKVPQEFIDCAASFGQFIVTGDKSMKDAETLAKMRRSAEYGGSDITDYLNKNPIGTGLVQAIHNHTEGNYKQSDRAKKERHKKELRTLTMKSMSKWRFGEHKLAEFIESAANDSIDGLKLEITTGSIENLVRAKMAKFNQYTLIITHKEVEYIEEDIKHGTLTDWWTDCNK